MIKGEYNFLVRNCSQTTGWTVNPHEDVITGSCDLATIIRTSVLRIGWPRTWYVPSNPVGRTYSKTTLRNRRPMPVYTQLLIVRFIEYDKSYEIKRNVYTENNTSYRIRIKSKIWIERFTGANSFSAKFNKKTRSKSVRANRKSLGTPCPVTILICIPF